MYTKFFGLNEKPFAITPDPRYLYMSARHDEGLAHLVYGVTESGGFIQLTGEVGTGKTTLVRTLLAQMPAEVNVALILNPQLTALEFLLAICDELKITHPQYISGTKELVDTLNRHLLYAHSNGRRTILLVDEAQNLSTDVLEQIRLLTNLETAKQKLLQIILIAQPELRDKLASTELRQLAQRVTGRCHLEPLSREETARYVEHRLKVAGALGEIFSDPAKREVYRLTGGVPRLINVICDRALLGAYSRDSRIVNRQLVRKAAAEVSDTRGTSIPHSWIYSAAALIVVAVALVWLWPTLRMPSPAASGNSTFLAAAPTTESAPATSSGVAEATAMPVQDVADDLEMTATLEETLRSNAAGADTSSAMTLLSELWGIDYDARAGTACSQAVAQGLSCLSRVGTWSVLRQLDRPVMLTLTDSEGANFQTALVSVEDNIAELVIGGTRHSYSVDEISKLWFGDFILLWRPPNGETAVLQRGMRGDNVRWLRQSLAALNAGYDGQSSEPELFDEELETQLREFQRRNRLRVDGLAGQQTQIIINSQLLPDGMPRLTASRR